jgi:hypothetical protein
MTMTLTNAASHPTLAPATVLWSLLAHRARSLGRLHHRDHAGDQMIDACNKIIALKVFSGEVATIYFWARWNKRVHAGDRGRDQPSG